MDIFLDSNGFYADYLLQRSEVSVFERYVKPTGARLHVPLVVVDEVTSKYCQKLDELQTHSDRVAHQRQRLGLPQIDGFLVVIDQARQRSIEDLSNRLVEIGVELLEYPHTAHPKLVEKIHVGSKPFGRAEDKREKGYRDALIWEAILQNIKGNEDEIVFITPDLNDYADRSGDAPFPLHSDLINELMRHGLPHENILIYPSLKQFNELEAQHLLKRVYRRGHPEQGGPIEGLDPTEILSRYQAYTVREVADQLVNSFGLSPLEFSLTRLTLFEWPSHVEIIFDTSKRPQPGDICIGPMGNQLFLFQIQSKAFDECTPSLLMAQEYPIPASSTDSEPNQNLHWYPLAYNSET